MAHNGLVNDTRIRFEPSSKLRAKLARRARYAKRLGFVDNTIHLVARSVLALGSFRAWDRWFHYEPKRKVQ